MSFPISKLTDTTHSSWSKQQKQKGAAASRSHVMFPRLLTLKKSAQTALDEFGRIDIAVAMAGILRRAPLEDMTDERFNDMLDIDLVGVLRLFRSAACAHD